MRCRLYLVLRFKVSPVRPDDTNRMILIEIKLLHLFVIILLQQCKVFFPLTWKVLSSPYMLAASKQLFKS